MNDIVTTAERLVRLEESVKYLREDVTELKQSQKSINEKLDELVAIKQKGSGIIWLLSGLLGEAGVVGIILFIFEHLKG